MRAWRFSSVRSGSRPAKTLAQRRVERRHHRLDRQLEQLAAEVLGELRARRRACPPTSTARASSRTSRRRRRARRRRSSATSVESIPPLKPEHDVLEAVLAHVVARAEDERGVDLVDLVEQRRDRRRAERRVARAVADGERARAGRPRRAPRPAGARRRVSRRRAEPAATASTSAISSASSNCGARAIAVPSWSRTTDEPSKTSSSWPPTRPQNATAARSSRARWASIRSRRAPLPASYGEAEMLTISARARERLVATAAGRAARCPRRSSGRR